METITINLEVFQKTISYLVHRPFIEVAELLQELKTEIDNANSEPTKEEE